MIDFVKVVGFATILIGAIVYLLKKLGENWIAAQFKAREDEASRQHEVRLQDIEMRHQEQLRGIEHQHRLLEQRESVVFDREHAERLSLIKSLHTTLSSYTHEWSNVLETNVLTDIRDRLRTISHRRKDLQKSILLAEPYLDSALFSALQDINPTMVKRERALIAYCDAAESGGEVKAGPLSEASGIVNSAVLYLRTELKQMLNTKFSNLPQKAP